MGVNENYSHHPSHHHNLGHTWLPSYTGPMLNAEDGRNMTSDTYMCSQSMSVGTMKAGTVFVSRLTETSRLMLLSAYINCTNKLLPATSQSSSTSFR
ncbi:hypothetical protein PAMP_001395 [Pampus punctatissimus]